MVISVHQYTFMHNFFLFHPAQKDAFHWHRSASHQGFNLLLHHFQLIIEQFLAYHTTIWRTQASRLLDQGCFICSPVSQACSHLRNATKKTADLTNTTRQRSGPLWEQHDLDWTEIHGFHEKTLAVKKELRELGEILQLNQNISFSIQLHCSCWCWYVVVFIPRHMWDWPGIEDLVAVKVLWFMARSPPSPLLPLATDTLPSA